MTLDELVNHAKALSSNNDLDVGLLLATGASCAFFAGAAIGAAFTKLLNKSAKLYKSAKQNLEDKKKKEKEEEKARFEKEYLSRKKQFFRGEKVLFPLLSESGLMNFIVDYQETLKGLEIMPWEVSSIFYLREFNRNEPDKNLLNPESPLYDSIKDTNSIDVVKKIGLKNIEDPVISKYFETLFSHSQFLFSRGNMDYRKKTIHNYVRMRSFWNSINLDDIGRAHNFEIPSIEPFNNAYMNIINEIAKGKKEKETSLESKLLFELKQYNLLDIAFFIKEHGDELKEKGIDEGDLLTLLHARDIVRQDPSIDIEDVGNYLNRYKLIEYYKTQGLILEDFANKHRESLEQRDTSKRFVFLVELMRNRFTFSTRDKSYLDEVLQTYCKNAQFISSLDFEEFEKPNPGKNAEQLKKDLEDSAAPGTGNWKNDEGKIIPFIYELTSIQYVSLSEENYETLKRINVPLEQVFAIATFSDIYKKSNGTIDENTNLRKIVDTNALLSNENYRFQKCYFLALTNILHEDISGKQINVPQNSNKTVEESMKESMGMYKRFIYFSFLELEKMLESHQRYMKTYLANKDFFDGLRATNYKPCALDEFKKEKWSYLDKI